nr:MAG TPA: hypothetical protein [Caudoviricetes sp.]
MSLLKFVPFFSYLPKSLILYVFYSIQQLQPVLFHLEVQ